MALRVLAGLTAVTAVVYYLKNKSQLAIKLLSLILVFEALHVLLYGFNGLDGLEYGDFVLIIQSSLNCIIGAIIVPVPLLILSKKIKSDKSDAIIKWGFISGTTYIVMLWLRFTSNWIAVLIQSEVYYSLLPGYGLEYILDYPLNLFGFLVTILGLPLLAIYFLKTDKTSSSKIFSKIGWTLTFLGFFKILKLIISISVKFVITNSIS